MAEGTETQRELVISDLHVPEHDPYAIELAAKIISIIKPDGLTIAGDGLDFRQLSSFDQDPDRAEERLQEELDEWLPVARMLVREMPKGAKKKYVPGNHEGDRLKRFLWRNAALSSLRVLQLAELMRLSDFDIEYHKDEYELLPDVLTIKHGSYVSPHSAFAAKRELENEKHSISTISGHTHRLGAHYVRTRRGVVAAWENGCLCRVDPDWTKRPNWQQGMSLVVHDGVDTFGVQQFAFVGEGKKKRTFVFGEEVRL